LNIGRRRNLALAHFLSHEKKTGGRPSAKSEKEGGDLHPPEGKKREQGRKKKKKKFAPPFINPARKREKTEETT